MTGHGWILAALLTVTGALSLAGGIALLLAGVAVTLFGGQL